ncbi:hypothetical protein B0J14DRAFT_603998 [Halenospora varia]|nr:hypothetical protein B0J14DRAFT_603998 [Halenospora varia]
MAAPASNTAGPPAYEVTQSTNGDAATNTTTPLSNTTNSTPKPAETANGENTPKNNKKKVPKAKKNANQAEPTNGEGSSNTNNNAENGAANPSNSDPNAARKTTKPKKEKAPKPPKAPELPFPEKLGNELAEGLVKDPRLFGKSLNLVDRVSFVKLPTANVPAVEEEEDDTPDSSLAGDFPILDDAGHATKRPSKEEKQPGEPRGWGREIFDLNDFAALAALQDLICRYGRVSHMGILDKSYTFFITKDRRAALYYKVKNKVAVVGGDPLCPPALFDLVLTEFEKYRKRWGLGLAFLGAGQVFVDHVRSYKKKYTTMCFAYERVLNPMTNPVLHSNQGKSITRITRNLLDPKKEGLTMAVYTPALGKNAALQQQLVNVYDAWRDARNNSGRPQAYITIYDPFALPDLMTYIYTKDRSGIPNGFAALRILGAEKGYHLDPYVSTPDAPKGITDLLIYGTMSLLNTAKISYLSLGYEPLDDLGEIQGIPKSFQSISRKVHKRIWDGLHVAGKKDYHDKFHPDDTQQSNLYIVFPPGIPSLRQMSAIVHVANIRMRKVMFKNPMAGMFSNMKLPEIHLKGKGKEGERKSEDGTLTKESTTTSASQSMLGDASSGPRPRPITPHAATS